MLTLSTPVYFGLNDRFKAYQFDQTRFLAEWYESYGQIYPSVSLSATIFVEDTTEKDCYNLPLIVFQAWSEEIDSLDQVIAIVRKRYPNAFDTREEYNTVYTVPYCEIPLYCESFDI